jgi:hypothetical protein
VNLLLAIVGVAAAVVGVITVRQIRHQTRAAAIALRISKRAADAAKQSADVAGATRTGPTQERAYIDLSHHPPGLEVDLFTATNGEDAFGPPPCASRSARKIEATQWAR